ncbi:MAG: hypothetical protein ACI3VB_07750 [Oscillospiraceae bacterium]
MFSQGKRPGYVIERKEINNMYKARIKVIASVLTLICLSTMVFTNCFAATTNIGSSTHSYTSNEPAYFKLQGDVTYSELSGNYMTIDSMSSRIWNYSTSDVDICCPYFKVTTLTTTHDTVALYNHIAVSPGTPNYYTNIDWKNYLNTYKNGASNRYTIPTSLNDSSAAICSEIGVRSDDYGSYSSIAYQYMAYWYGNGTVRLLDLVCDDAPVWTTKYVNTVSANSVLFSLTSGEVENYSAEKTDSIIQIEVSSDEVIQIGSLPKISTDAEFEDCIEINPEQVQFVGNDSLQIVLDDGLEVEQLYVKMPTITIIDETASATVNNTEGLEAVSTYDEDTGVRLLILSYGSEDLPLIPNSAELTNDSAVDFIASQVFFDSEGNATGGKLYFAIPDTYDITSAYTLKLVGELVNVDGPVVQVQAG